MINVNFPFITDGRRTEDLGRREEESGGWAKPPPLPMEREMPQYPGTPCISPPSATL